MTNHNSVNAIQSNDSLPLPSTILLLDSMISSGMAPVQKQDAERALRLLEHYHSKLSSPQDIALRNALERAIKLFRSKLFYALIDIQEYYEEILRDVSKSPEHVAQEALIIAKKWERHPETTAEEQESQLSPVSNYR